MKAKIYLLRISLFILAGTNKVLADGSANGGQAGLQKATEQIGSYFEDASKLILAIAAIVGLAGGIRCYIKWNTGDQDVMKSVMGWGAACIFLIIVSVVIKAFFVPNAAGG